MTSTKQVRIVAGAALLALGLLAGCKSDEQKALDQAKAQAAQTNTAQQIQYVDNNGNTVTTVVQPPAQQGAAEQVTTNVQSPPPGAPKPAHTKPVVMPLGPGAPYGQPTAVAGQNYQEQTTANGQSYPAGQPVPAGQTTTTSTNQYTSSTEQPYPNGQAYNAPAQQGFSLTVPAGTELAVRINQSINVKHTHAGEHFTGEIAAPVVRNGNVIIPRGTPVRGRVDAAHRRGHFKGSSLLELRLTSMVLNNHEYALDTHDNVHYKKGKGKRTAGWIGGLGGAGALIGGLASGGVGLAIGAASGAGAGTVIAGTTGNRDIDIPAESVQHFRLSDDLIVQNP